MLRQPPRLCQAMKNIDMCHARRVRHRSPCLRVVFHYCGQGIMDLHPVGFSYFEYPDFCKEVNNGKENGAARRSIAP